MEHTIRITFNGATWSASWGHNPYPTGFGPTPQEATQNLLGAYFPNSIDPTPPLPAGGAVPTPNATGEAIEQLVAAGYTVSLRR